MEINLILEGLRFMVLGMVSVFLFLILLIFTLKLQAFIISKCVSSDKTTPKQNLCKQEVSGSSELVAAISVAIMRFKNR